jgi:hypothetical protein
MISLDISGSLRDILDFIIFPRSQGEEPLRFLIKKKGVEAAASRIRTRALALMDSTTTGPMVHPLDFIISVAN